VRWIVLAAIPVAVACSSSPKPVVAAAPAAPDSLQQQSLARARQDSIDRAEAARQAAARAAEQRRADSVAAAQRRADEARATLGVMLHFDYDQAVIRSDDAVLLDQKLAILRSTAGARIRIAGNCDERGSDEYNLALGNRRAMAARQYLVDRGIDPSRIETTSLGEEQPVDPGHTEVAWAKNRNDQFALLNAVVF
jgi:peptidoglycan-associated lipoprotein